MQMKRLIAVGILATAMLATTLGTPASGVYRPYGRNSYWNRELPTNAQTRGNSDTIMTFLRRDNDTHYIRLAGTSSDGAWGLPIYWARSAATTYDVGNNCFVRPAARIRPRSHPADRHPRSRPSDAAMVVYDRGRGRVYGFYRARYDASLDRWYACGGTVSYLGSNGLDGALAASNEPRNRGHRGLPPPTWAVRRAEIAAGSIHHILRIAVNTTRCATVFPMVANECGTNAVGAPPEGTRIRIKPSVDLTQLRLSPAALVIARALKRYGAVIGDQTGGPITLKVENTIAEGRGWLWNGVLRPDSLRTIPLRSFEVIRPRRA